MNSGAAMQWRVEVETADHDADVTVIVLSARECGRTDDDNPE